MVNGKNSLSLMAGKRLFGILLIIFIFSVSIPGRGKFQKSSKSPDLKRWTAGSSSLTQRYGVNFYEVMGRLDAEKKDLDKFLYAMAETPLSKPQILQQTGFTEEQVSRLISSLSSIKLIRTFDQDKWAPTIPIITNQQMKRIIKSLDTMAENTAKYLKTEASNLRSLYNSAKRLQDPLWKDLTHLFFCKLIIDGKFHRNLNILINKRKRRRSEGIDQSGTSLFFFERGSDYISLGSNWYAFKKDGKQREIFILHGPVYNRYHVPVEKYRRSREFCSAYFKIPTAGGIKGLPESEKTMFKELGWIDNGKMLIPIVKNITVLAISSALENIGKKAAEIAFANFEDILDQYEKGPYSKFLKGSKDYVQASLHILFGMVAERLIAHGIVTKVPDPLPENFGVYFVFGKLF